MTTESNAYGLPPDARGSVCPNVETIDPGVVIDVAGHDGFVVQHGGGGDDTVLALEPFAVGNQGSGSSRSADRVRPAAPASSSALASSSVRMPATSDQDRSPADRLTTSEKLSPSRMGPQSLVSLLVD